MNEFMNWADFLNVDSDAIIFGSLQLYLSFLTVAKTMSGLCETQFEQKFF